MIKKYNKKEIVILRQGGRRLAGIVEQLREMVEIGENALNIEKKANGLFKQSEGRPSFLNYQGFPSSLCISTNNEVVHTAPYDYEFKSGDIVAIDAGLNFKGMHTDMAVTVVVENASKEINQFVKTTKEALDNAIKMALPGTITGDIGLKIQKTVEGRGYSVVRELAGHGIGKELHMDPSIPNFGKKGKGTKLYAGMVIAIEPIINMGKAGIISEKNKHRVITKDGSLSAHFEHTILITSTGAEILTEI